MGIENNENINNSPPPTGERPPTFDITHITNAAFD